MKSAAETASLVNPPSTPKLEEVGRWETELEQGGLMDV
jgi:hypothetical protein